MDQLEREGYVTGFHASINHALLGYHIKAFITIAVKAPLRDEFLDYMRQCRNVIECSCITGDYAMLLEVVYPCTEALEQFVAKIQRYGKTKTQIVYSTAVERRGVLQEPEIEKAG